MTEKTNATVLDACCGSRMFWFDRGDDRVTFMDIREEEHVLADKTSPTGYRTLVIDPDVVGDFRAMPFSDGTFRVVVFDPPHLIKHGKTGWLARKYGALEADWRDDLRAGFAECFRVLVIGGVLIFKWSETDIPIAQVLALTDQKPLFGHRTGARAGTHWIAFMKIAGVRGHGDLFAAADDVIDFDALRAM